MSVKPVEHVSVLVACHDYYKSSDLALFCTTCSYSQHFNGWLCVVFTIDILKFDNSYSWARSKEVFYTIKLLPPGAKPHLHVPPGEMEKAESGEGNHTPNSSPSSTHSSEFYDCDVNDTDFLQVSPSDDAQMNMDDSDQQKGACGSSR